MVYCTKCGTQNDDDAEFCKKCGATLGVTRRDYNRERDQRCEEECSGGKNRRGWAIFWGIIIVLVGLAILFEVVFKGLWNTYKYPWLEWANTINFGWIFGAVIAIVIIIFGLRMVTRN